MAIDECKAFGKTSRSGGKAIDQWRRIAEEKRRLGKSGKSKKEQKKISCSLRVSLTGGALPISCLVS
ncbi:MAG: hypothetical protein WC588_00555 [Candidatus Micrarchaeia archaeon]